MPQDEAALLDMMRAAQLAVQFVGAMGRDSFLKDPKTQSAVLHQLLLLGEAAKRLSGGFREDHPEIQWRQITGMRDVLIHQYNHVDLDEIWRTVQTSVPRLISALEPLVPRESSSKGDR